MNNSPQAFSTRAARWLRQPVTWLWLLVLVVAIDVIVPPTPIAAPLTADVGAGSVTVERTPSSMWHPEYERALVVYRDGREIGRQSMSFDTGGTVRLNVYRDGDEGLILIDRMGAYVVRLDDGSVTGVRGQTANRADGSVYGKPPAGFPRPHWVFIGAFDNIGKGKERTFRFVPVAERAEQVLEPQG